MRIWELQLSDMCESKKPSHLPGHSLYFVFPEFLLADFIDCKTLQEQETHVDSLNEA
jgi:hypothetical protein